VAEKVLKNVEGMMFDMIEDGARVVEIDNPKDLSTIIKKNTSSFETARQQLDKKVNSANY
jgi:hypothetical protein